MSIPQVIDIAKPVLGDEEWQALREPLESGWLTQGPKVRAFEEAFALRHGVRYAVATTSCTTALHLALSALNVGPGDEVIVPAFTFVATANAVLYCGATPIFVDVRLDTYNIDSALVSAAVTDRTRAVIPVHLFGLCADIESLRTAVPDRVAVIEDAACAAGSAYKGIPAGSLGLAGCFSFHPRKSITTGEGGMLTTDDEALAKRARTLRSHGASVSEEMRHHSRAPQVAPAFNVIGYNYRMTDLQAAIGLVQLGKLDRFIAERRIWASWYGEQLGDLEWLNLPVCPDNCTHGWQSFVARLRDDAPLKRNDLMARLQAMGISTRQGTHAVTELNYYRDRYDLRQKQFPNAAKLQEQTLALPLHNAMSPGDYERVSTALHSVV